MTDSLLNPFASLFLPLIESVKLEWGWNAHAETYYVSAKVGQKGTRFLVGGGGGGGVWRWCLVGGWWSDREEWRDLSSEKLLFAISFLRFEAHLNRALCGGSF